MNLPQLKLTLIQRILQCDDARKLQAIEALLPGFEASDAPPWEALSVSSLSPDPAGAEADISNADLEELQQSINRIFGE
jgi:hypothetical protein